MSLFTHLWWTHAQEPKFLTFKSDPLFKSFLLKNFVQGRDFWSAEMNWCQNPRWKSIREGPVGMNFRNRQQWQAGWRKSGKELKCWNWEGFICPSKVCVEYSRIWRMQPQPVGTAVAGCSVNWFSWSLVVQFFNALQGGSMRQQCEPCRSKSCCCVIQWHTLRDASGLSFLFLFLFCFCFVFNFYFPLPELPK